MTKESEVNDEGVNSIKFMVGSAFASLLVIKL